MPGPIPRRLRLTFHWLFFLILGIPVVGYAQPTIAKPAAASPNPVTGITTALTVLGSDPAGESSLTYTWSATGPASITFSSNNSNSSKATTATFKQAGSYGISVVIRNSSGGSASSNVAVTVNQTVSTVTISPSSATVTVNSSQQFTARVVDQFGNTMAAPAKNTGWTNLVNTHLQSACPPDYYNGINYAFYSLCPYVISSWDGATADTKRNRMIIWGGGHNNYWGNEVFSLNLNSNSPTLTLLTEPSAFASSGCPDANPDGTPVARETFNGLLYLPIQDLMLSFDGDKAPCGSGSGHTWDLVLSATPPVWHALDPVNGFNPAAITAAGGGSVTGSACDYDPNSQFVYCVWSGVYELLRYSYVTNTWAQLTGYSSTLVPLASTPVIDPVRKLMIFIGDDYHTGNPHVMAIDISPGSDYVVQDWSHQVTGCTGLAGVDYPGVAYDSVLNKIVGWPGTGNTIYIFNPDTKTCTAETFPNGPTNTTNNNGVFGRFRYFPSLNAHAVVSDANVDAYLLRVSTSGVGWLVNGGGHVSGSGLFTAGIVDGGPYIVSATVSGVKGTATVSVGETVSPVLAIHADATEVSGVTNGSSISPSIAPSALSGKLIVNGTGSVHYASAKIGNGVYFLNCCGNTNNAYYRFTGTGVGTAFNVNQGQITFYLKSRYSFAQRAASAAAPRYAFDVRDGNGKHMFYFLTQVYNGILYFTYVIAGTGQYYWVPKGTEDSVYGNGIVLPVTMSWKNGVANLYLNGRLVKSTTYTPAAPNWSAASVFDLGAYEYQTFGGYNVSDDIIDEFTVSSN